MCQRGENFDNKFMEQQIVSMLENVLGDDSEEEFIKPKDIYDENFETTRENIINFREEEFWPKRTKENTLAPKIFINDSPVRLIDEPSMSKFKRKEKKSNTADPISNRNTLYLDGTSAIRTLNSSCFSNHASNLYQNYNSNCNPLSCYSLEPGKNYNSHNSSLKNQSISPTTTSSVSKSTNKVHEDIPPDMLYWNEYDEILENYIRPNEEISEESYKMLKGKIFNVLMTQNGSRVLQKALKKTKFEIISLMFDEISDKFSNLMMDSYANYFCPRFFSLLKKDQRKIFLLQILNKMFEIGTSKIGTYPLQSIIDQLNSEEEKAIVANSLNGKILDMCLDPQGTHVIEKIITCFEEKYIEDYYNIIIDNIMTLADNVNGLCVCKKIINHVCNLKIMKRIREKLIENAIFLIQNVYGNYVIQMAIEKWSVDFCFPVVKSFQNNVYFLSMQKYSSNVIEKCLEKGYENLYEGLIAEISMESKIIDLIKSPYGNYVIQKALKLSKLVYKRKLISLILKDLKKLEDKKLIAKWKMIINNIQSANKNTNLIADLSYASTNHSEVSLNSPNFCYNNPNTLSINYNNYDRLSRSLLGSPQFISPFLILNNNNSPNNVYPNFVTNNQNNFSIPFCLNYTNNNNYYI